MKTLVVNLFGVPGSGKSTGAAYIFARLKMKGINAELVTEYAKDKVWEENNEVFRNQAYLLGKQSYRLSRLDGKVDVIVTDSPLPLSILYNEDERLNETFNQSVMDVFNSYNNMNFLLRRTKSYNPSGRRQTEAESDALGAEIIQLLNERHIYCKQVDGDIGGYDSIVYTIEKEFVPDIKSHTITPGQTIRYFTWMCRACECYDCPLGKFADALKMDKVDCYDIRCKYHEDTGKIVQEWAVQNGYLTKDLEETGKFDLEYAERYGN